MTTSTPEFRRRRQLRFLLNRQQITGLLWQVVVVGIAVAIVAFLWSNALHNLSVRRISTGFTFLGREAGMPIADTWLAYSPKDPYVRAFIVGIVNTLRVAVIGIVLATVIGTRGCRRTGCCRGLPPSMSNCSATFPCCCNCCSGTC